MSSTASPVIALPEGRPDSRLRPTTVVTLAAALGGALPWAAAGWPGAAAALTGATLALLIAVTAWRAGLTGRRFRVRTGWWRGDGTWQLQLADGRTVEGRLSGRSRVLPGLMLLVWRTPSGRLCRVICATHDRWTPETRRLRVRLRVDPSVVGGERNGPE